MAFAMLPSCLTLSVHPQVLQRRCRQLPLVSCAAGEGRRVVSSAAPPAAASQRATHPRPSSNPMNASRMARFDAALRAGHVEGALAVLREAAVVAGGTPIALLNPHRNRDLIQACFVCGSPDKAVSYLQLLHPAVAPWSAVMKEANKRRDLPTMHGVLAARQAAGLPLDQHCTTAAISGLGVGRRVSDALAIFFRAWERQDCRTVEVVNAAIAACANQGNWEAAQEVLSIMEREGIQPDVITYNSLMKVAGEAGMMDEVLRLYGELRAVGLWPSAFTYATLFTAAAKTRHSDADWLLQTLDEMAGARVEPNNYIVSALFSAASYAPCTPAQQEQLFAMLAQLRSYGPPNDTVYAALLTLIQRQAIHERAVDVWTAVKQDGVRQTPHLFSSLFAACARGTSPALVEVAIEVAGAMQAQWQGAVSRGQPKLQYERDMLVAYNALLHFLGSIGELQHSLGIYGGMQRQGPAPDVVTFNTLIAAAAGQGDVRAGMHIFSDMVDADIEPTEHTAGALLNCYAKARDAASARRVFEGMGQLGIRPNLEMYTSLIDACVQAGGEETQLAFELLEEMRNHGLAPSAVTYGCLLAACEKRGDVSRAFQLYQQACDEGVVPSDQMHDMLINMCTEADRLDDAVDLVKRLARSSSVSQQGSALMSTGGSGRTGSTGPAALGGSLHEHTLNSLIRALCGKYVDRALRLLSLFQAMGLRPSRRTYLSLIAGCAKASHSAAAYDLYRSLRAQGMDADGTSGSALIVSLCQANELDVAETVYNDMLACAWRRELQALPAPMARRGGLSNRARTPDAEALAALVQAFAAAKDLRRAAKYYKQLRRVGKKGLAAVAVSHRRMWEALIENYCRQHKVKQALQVFDDWKAARDDWLATVAPASTAAPAAAAAAAVASSPGAASPSPPAARYPKLSNVSLAFLEACCRSEPDCEWRVYDVCAVMRQQKELKQQAGLARPQKQSHHFAPA